VRSGPKISSVAMRAGTSAVVTIIGPTYQPPAGDRVTPVDDVPFRRRDLVIATQAPERVLVDEWPDHGPELPRMADRHDCRRPDETLHELVEDRARTIRRAAAEHFWPA
jgi:hypothetical protein